jgi:hypothetical protein
MMNLSLLTFIGIHGTYLAFSYWTMILSIADTLDILGFNVERCHRINMSGVNCLKTPLILVAVHITVLLCILCSLGQMNVIIKIVTYNIIRLQGGTSVEGGISVQVDPGVVTATDGNVSLN